jgi:hypothetical protein
LQENTDNGRGSGLNAIEEASARLIVNFADRDLDRPERSMNFGLRALRIRQFDRLGRWGPAPSKSAMPGFAAT